MGSVSVVRMKPGIMPSKFDCQPDRTLRSSHSMERPFIAKKRRLMAIKECEKELEESNIITQHSGPEHIPTASGSASEGIIYIDILMINQFIAETIISHKT